MPGGDGTGPYGTFINCTDPRTGLTRPLNRYRTGGFTPPAYAPSAPPVYQRYPRYAYAGYPYTGYGYRGYGYPRYGYRGYGYGLGMRWGRGWGGRRRGRW